ncbi:MAG: hypothetical protein ACYDHW_08320 [Syntrophorhabdaceae bacterium]
MSASSQQSAMNRRTMAVLSMLERDIWTSEKRTIFRMALLIRRTQ